MTVQIAARQGAPVALVTGGAGGLGSVIADRLARDGSTVIIADRDGDAAVRRAREVADAHGTEVVGWSADISTNEGNRELLRRVEATYGRLDQLVNNAAVNQSSGFGDIEDAEWHALMAVNLWGPASLCQAAASLWRRTGGGAVVNISSRTWLSGGPLGYVSSKAGIVGLTRALAVELGPSNVTVNAVAPSTVLTPFVTAGRSEGDQAERAQRHRSMTALGRLATPADVAEAVAFLVSPRAAFITGEVLHVAGGAQLAPAP